MFWNGLSSWGAKNAKLRKWPLDCPSMADYYPLIARAVSAVDENTGESRRALYERARSALVNQLRSVNPPLSDSDIICERLALEQAIRQVEAEAERRSGAEVVEKPKDRPQPHDNFGIQSRESASREERQPAVTVIGRREFRKTGAEGPNGVGTEGKHSLRNNNEVVLMDRPPYEEPLAHSVGDPRARAVGGGQVNPIQPARSYGLLIKLALFLLIIVSLVSIAYWQRYPLMASLSSLSELDYWDLSVPIFAFGVVAYIFAYTFLRRWFGNRS